MELSRTCSHLQRRRRGIFVDYVSNRGQAPEERHIPMMSLLTELGIILWEIFYKYAAPMALLLPGKQG
jgi:hypothetical protein